MRKAFTLVEMSIVLVIIGVLMGLTIKGKQLIDAAKLRGDINKVRNVRIAIATYLTDNNGVFRNGFNKNDLSKVLSPEDFVLVTATDPLSVGQVLVIDQAASCTGNNCGGHIRDASTGDIVAVILGKLSAESDITNKAFGCKVDAVLDDKIQGSGTVRAYFTGSVPFGPRTDPLEMAECDAATTTDLSYAALGL